MFSSSERPAEDREFIDLKAALGKLMIVRPLEYKEDFKTTFSPDGTDVVFADIAVVDEVDQATGQQGKIYRSQAILQGYLKGTFKRKIGEMIVGMLYLGPPQKGRPPFLWQDLYTDATAVARATAWVTANQQFLVQLAPSVPEPSGPPAYVPPATVPPGTTTLEQMRQQSFGALSDNSIPF